MIVVLSLLFSRSISRKRNCLRLVHGAMAESMCSSFASLDAERDVPRAVEFKTMEKEEFFIDEQVKVHFQFPDEAHCPNYLDVVRILPVNSYTALVDAASGCGDTNGGQLSKMSSSLAASKTDDDFETLNSSVLSGALTFSYCQWKVESAPGLFSVSAEGDKDNIFTLIKTLISFSVKKNENAHLSKSLHDGSIVIVL